MSVKMTTEAKYGSWESPITSKMIAKSSRAFQEIHVDLNPNYADTVYWSEMRYDDNGRYVICSQKTGESSFKDWNNTPYSARTTVHEYGGGAFFVYKGKVYFSNFIDQRMYLLSSAGADPVAITPADQKWRYADGVISRQSGLIYSVREDHTGDPEPKDVVNTLVMFDPNDPKMSQIIIATGRNFYSSPRVSPDGTKLAWFEWNFPNMPWDDTDLCVGTLDSTGVIQSKVLVDGGSSIMQPFWGPDNSLFYISDATNWWNVYQLIDVSGSGDPVNILPRNKETGGPQWTFAEFAYAVDQVVKNKRIIATTAGALGVVDLQTKTFTPIDTNYTSHDFVNVLQNGEIYCVAASRTEMPVVIRISSDFSKVDVLRKSKDVTGLDGFLSEAQDLQWTSSDGGTAYGYYYPPTNKNFVGLPETLPPLLVKTHGGPTSATNKNLNLNIQYVTSRGFAVLDTNYRGSTGYGRQYRRSLYLKWGIYDIDDVTAGATYLAVNKGLVDKDKLSIDGGSSGGYTTLAALTFRSTFQAGVSNYGICDLTALVKYTHKFESRYTENLVAPWPAGIKTYKERSPVNHPEKINSPAAFFQGAKDKVVPPEQSKEMYDAVYEKGLPCMFQLFPDEEHGFRKAQNIQKSIDGEFYFFSKLFDFEAYNNYFPIDNLPKTDTYEQQSCNN